jgi:hypothetical protein
MAFISTIVENIRPSTNAAEAADILHSLAQAKIKEE